MVIFPKNATWVRSRGPRRNGRFDTRKAVAMFVAAMAASIESQNIDCSTMVAATFVPSHSNSKLAASTATMTTSIGFGRRLKSCRPSLAGRRRKRTDEHHGRGRAGGRTAHRFEADRERSADSEQAAHIFRDVALGLASLLHHAERDRRAGLR